MILKAGKNRFKMVGAKIAEQYTPEELGIIIAQMSIGQAIKSFDIKLTGEAGMESKGRGKKNSRGRNFDRRGGRGGNRSSRGGSRSQGGNRSSSSRNGSRPSRGSSSNTRRKRR